MEAYMRTAPARLGLALGLSAILAACGDSGTTDPGRGLLVDAAPTSVPLPAAAIAANTQGLRQLLQFTQNVLPAAVCNVEVVPLHYQTVGVRVERTTASGVMLIPSGSDPVCAGPFPLVSYSRGTDINQKRLLADPTDTETGALAAFFASQGKVVVATDYLGYGKSDYGFHPYLHADSQATSVIDAMRAARRLASARNVPLSGAVLLYGYSQGGHASMSAHRAIEGSTALSDEFGIVAAAHGAAPAGLKSAVEKSPPTVSGQFFVPFFITAWQRVYGGIYTSTSEVFKAPFAADIESVFLSRNYTFTSALTNGKLPASAPPDWYTSLFTDQFRGRYQSDPALLAAAEKNDFFEADWTPRARTMLCAGSADPTVPFEFGQRMMKNKWTAQIGTGRVVEVDVDPLVQAVMIPAICQQTDPVEQMTCVATKYHGELAPPLCLNAVRSFFDQWLPN
jgi:pimeloyl-ACP methyl ester carboxylesterase